jgi:hypothetical protein
MVHKTAGHQRRVLQQCALLLMQLYIGGTINSLIMVRVKRAWRQLMEASGRYCLAVVEAHSSGVSPLDDAID